MSIEAGQKYIDKDGEVVDVISLRKNYYGYGDLEYEYGVWFEDREETLHVLIERDFLEQYKPYEVVYEYKYVIGSTKFQEITNKFYKSDEELMSSEETYSFICQSFQRLDFTKRERK